MSEGREKTEERMVRREEGKGETQEKGEVRVIETRQG